MTRIVCDRTGATVENAAEARALGWRQRWAVGPDVWESPAPGWERAQIARDHVEYEGGIDFDPVPLDFGGDR